jgi:hypothetical protein
MPCLSQISGDPANLKNGEDIMGLASMILVVVTASSHLT